MGTSANAENTSERTITGTTTTVAVLEFGNGGTVRRTTSTSPNASVSSVQAFWANLHDMDPHGRRPKTVQPAGMNMVPDFFQKSNGGIIVSLTGVNEHDLTSMTTLSSALDSSNNNEKVIGQFHLAGSHAKSLTRTKGGSKNSNEFKLALKEVTEQIEASPKEENKVQMISLHLDHESGTSSSIDQSIAEMFQSLQSSAEASGSTFVVHLVVEEENGADRHANFVTANAAEEKTSRRRLESVKTTYGSAQRQLEDDGESDKRSIYYGFGYYDANGEWYTPYKTIYEIQTFQVFTWSALGILGILLMSMNKLINMPLMPDTLLFGESAKMSAD